MQTNKKSKFGLALIVVISSTVLVTSPSFARNSDYDGYCYQRNDNTRTKGTIIGAISGAVIGSNVAASGNRGGGTALGAVLGGVIGSQIGAQIKETNNARCMNNVYYRYSEGYYAPSAPPRGYRVAYFYDRPNGVTYYKHRNNNYHDNHSYYQRPHRH